MRERLLVLVTVCSAVGACQSSSNDNTGAPGVGRAGTAGETGAAGGRPAAGAGNGPVSAGTTGNAGSEGSAAGAGLSSGAEAGNGGDPGVGDGMAGATQTADGGAAPAGEGEGGEAGAPGRATPVYAYLSTFLGGIFAFSIDDSSGKPELLPGSPVDVNAQIYALSVAPSQRHLYVLDLRHKLDVFALNAGGSLAAAPLSSTAIPGSPVTLALDPKGRFAYVGTQTDEPKSLVLSFKLDATTGSLTSAGPALELSGAPAYVAVDPTGQFAYVTESSSFGIAGYAIDQSSGLLTPLETPSFGGNAVFGGAIAFRPDGKFLYTTGNGLNAFAIDRANGKLERVQGSPFNAEVSSDPTATNLAIDPGGKFLYATQFVGGSRVFGFSIDDASGKLSQVPGGALPLSVPYSLAIEPSGRFLYVGRDDGKLSVLAVSRRDGSLHEIDGSPIEHGGLQPELAFVRALSGR